VNEDIDNISAEMAEQREILRRAHDELLALGELRDEYLDRHLATLTDEQIMGDEPLLRRVLKEAFYHRGASKIVHRLYSTGRQDVVAENVDGRDEWEGSALPALDLRLIEGQDVEELEGAIQAWAGTWALGRPDLRIGITERTLSRWGGYHLIYRPGKVLAELEGPYGREILLAPLRACLERIAQDFWCQRADGSSGDPDDDYPYYRD
jgi:hypothetical protein